MYKRNTAYLFMVIFVMALLSGCGPKPIDPTLPSEDKFAIYSFKTWKSVDIAADAIYKSFGDLYRDGKITEEQKDELIKIGEYVRESMIMARTAMEGYLWVLQTNENVDDKKEKVLNSLKGVIYAFNDMRDEAEKVYSMATGQQLNIPSPFIFEALASVL